jgi:hypothetical protein
MIENVPMTPQVTAITREIVSISRAEMDRRPNMRHPVKNVNDGYVRYLTGFSSVIKTQILG